MLKWLNRLALRLRPLQNVLLVLMPLALIAMAALLLNAGDQQQNRYLLPLLVAFLWMLSAYALVTNFQAIPDTAGGRRGLITKIRAIIRRIWYWLIGVTFIICSLGVLALSWKLIGIWLKDY